MRILLVCYLMLRLGSTQHLFCADTTSMWEDSSCCSKNAAQLLSSSQQNEIHLKLAPTHDRMTNISCSDIQNAYKITDCCSAGPNAPIALAERDRIKNLIVFGECASTQYRDTSTMNCADTTVCDSTKYVSEPSDGSRDVTCTDLTQCDSMEYESVPPSSLSDRVCSSRSICAENQYILQEATLTEDRICSDYTTCGSSQYESVAPTSNGNRVCAYYNTCSSEQYEFSAASLYSDRVCAQITVCTTDQCERIAPTLYSDRVCVLSECPESQTSMGSCMCAVAMFTPSPTPAPTSPTNYPTKTPTSSPTPAPTAPTESPTSSPTTAPSASPTPPPTASPTPAPTPPPTRCAYTTRVSDGSTQNGVQCNRKDENGAWMQVMYLALSTDPVQYAGKFWLESQYAKAYNDNNGWGERQNTVVECEAACAAEDKICCTYSNDGKCTSEDGFTAAKEYLIGPSWTLWEAEGNPATLFHSSCADLTGGGRRLLSTGRQLLETTQHWNTCEDGQVMIVGTQFQLPSLGPPRCTAAIPICPQGTYETSPPSEYIDRVCIPATTCVKSQYESISPTNNQNRVCSTPSSCLLETVDMSNTSLLHGTLTALGSFQVHPPSATADRTCKSYSRCNELQFISRYSSPYSDRVCKNITDCIAGVEFLVSSPTRLKDAICQNIKSCPSGKFQTAEATTISDVLCDDVTLCPYGYSESRPPNATANRECVYTDAPTAQPTMSPTVSPSTPDPTVQPTVQPTAEPTAPTDSPTLQPTKSPTAPTQAPTLSPTTSQPTESPSDSPTAQPTVSPTSSQPTTSPTPQPTPPTQAPTAAPTPEPCTDGSQCCGFEDIHNNGNGWNMWWLTDGTANPIYSRSGASWKSGLLDMPGDCAGGTPVGPAKYFYAYDYVNQVGDMDGALNCAKHCSKQSREVDCCHWKGRDGYCLAYKNTPIFSSDPVNRFNNGAKNDQSVATVNNFFFSQWGVCTVGDNSDNGMYCDSFAHGISCAPHPVPFTIGEFGCMACQPNRGTEGGHLEPLGGITYTQCHDECFSRDNWATSSPEDNCYAFQWNSRDGGNIDSTDGFCYLFHVGGHERGNLPGGYSNGVCNNVNSNPDKTYRCGVKTGHGYSEAGGSWWSDVLA